MNPEFQAGGRLMALTVAMAAALSMSGCGGGGGDSSGGTPPPPPPATQSISGVVIDGAIQGATVCLDVNANGSCDSGEPVSGATDAQGNYTITGLTTAQLDAGSPLVAVVPATAIDADTGVVGTAYVMRAPAGKHAVISPITTLVQTGVAQGMTQAAAETAVATQLQVSASSLYNNFTTSSAGDNAALRTAVPLVVSSLQAGEQLVVSAPSTSPAPGYWVRQFNFTNTSNHYLRYYYSDNVADANGLYTYYDVRTSVVGGVPASSTTLYDSALLATPQGWKAFNGAMPNTSSRGSPAVSQWGNGYVYLTSRVDTDVSGQSIASVVAQIQDLSLNTTSSVVGVNASGLTGTMPAGSAVRRIRNVNTAAPVAYRVADGSYDYPSLAALVSAFPVPSSPTAGNTASMASLHGSAGCGASFCAQERLRVAFGANNAATYYLCDIDQSTNTTSNCQQAGTGTYAIGTAVDGSTPIMTFASLPAATSVQTFTRVFVARNGRVWFGWQDKPAAPSVQTRLNKVAFEALAAALNITPPTISDAASAYAGVWTASYTGGDTGDCASVYIDANGRVNGWCLSSGVGGTFLVTGTVNATGVASFSATGSTSSGASFTGSFTATAGSGTWTWPSHSATGTWSATKQ